MTEFLYSKYWNHDGVTKAPTDPEKKWHWVSHTVQTKTFQGTNRNAVAFHDLALWFKKIQTEGVYVDDISKIKGIRMAVDNLVLATVNTEMYDYVNPRIVFMHTPSGGDGDRAPYQQRECPIYGADEKIISFSANNWSYYKTEYGYFNFWRAISKRGYYRLELHIVPWNGDTVRVRAQATGTNHYVYQTGIGVRYETYESYT